VRVAAEPTQRGPRWIMLRAMQTGILPASANQLPTGNFTEMNRRPARDIGQSSETGAATVISSGVPAAMEPGVYSAPLTGGTPPGQLPNITERAR